MSFKSVSPLFLSLILPLAACSGNPAGESPDDELSPRVTYTAIMKENGRCQPEGLAVVNKEKTHLYKIHGEVDYVDIRNGDKTDIPLQFLFRGYDGFGMSKDNNIVGINTETPCDQLKLDIEVQYCLYDTLGSADERACPDGLIFEGEGFAEISVERGDTDNPGYE